MGTQTEKHLAHNGLILIREKSLPLVSVGSELCMGPGQGPSESVLPSHPRSL